MSGPAESMRSTSSKARSTTLTANPCRLRRPSADGHLGRDAGQHGDDRRVARQPRLGLDQEPVEGQAVAQLDAGQDLANPGEDLGAPAGRNDQRTEPVVVLAHRGHLVDGRAIGPRLGLAPRDLVADGGSGRRRRGRW